MPRHRRGWAMDQESPEVGRLTPLTGSLVEPALLVLLKEKPQHGYTLVDSLSELGLSTPHPSVVYRVLRDMENLQWISSQWDADASQGPPRRIYALTSQGEVILRKWQFELEKAVELINELNHRIK